MSAEVPGSPDSAQPQQQLESWQEIRFRQASCECRTRKGAAKASIAEAEVKRFGRCVIEK